MIKIEVIGNIGADAEIKDSQGQKFVTFRVANTDKWKDANGVEHAQTDWVDCVLNNAESKLVPYLKQGVKVFVRGNARLRVYSSKKDRMMKAGLSINVLEVELCGGSSDDVPRQLIVPETGAIVNVDKWYHVPMDTKHFKKDDIGVLVDQRGRQYLFNKACWVIPSVDQSSDQSEQTEGNNADQNEPTDDKK